MRKIRFIFAFISAFVLGLGVAATGLWAQEAGTKSEAPAAGRAEAKAGQEYSGMYSFQKEGEFVQVTVEEAGHVTGFVSRFGDGESDKGAFLDQFFKSRQIKRAILKWRD